MNIEKRKIELTAKAHEELVDDIINRELNDLVSGYADVKEDEVDEFGHGKRVPYIGWFWRSVDFANSSYTIGDCGDFIGFMENKGYAPGTIRNYHDTLLKFSGMFPLLPLNLEAISSFLSLYSGEEHDEYRLAKFRNLRAFYYWIADYKDYPPAHMKFRLLTPHVKHKVKANLSNEQATQFLALMQSMPPRDRVLIDLIIEAGPRAGEVCSIR